MTAEEQRKEDLYRLFSERHQMSLILNDLAIVMPLKVETRSQAIMQIKDKLRFIDSRIESLLFKIKNSNNSNKHTCIGCSYFRTQKDMLVELYDEKIGLCVGSQKNHHLENGFYSLGNLIVHKDHYCKEFKKRNKCLHLMT